MADEDGAFGGLEARLRALAERVRAGLPERARELRGAVSALRSGEGEARAALRRHAHKLRGTAGSHGFSELTEPAAAVETAAEGAEVEALATLALRLADAVDRTAGAGTAGAGIVPSAPVAPAPVVATAASQATPLEGLRMLAIDDDAATRKLLTLTLANLGKAHAVVEDSATRFLDRLAAEAFDVVIVDAMMPEVNGLELLTRIAGSPAHRERAHYFVLSAATAAELGWTLPPSLTVGWLRKPFRPRELLDALAQHLGRATPTA